MSEPTADALASAFQELSTQCANFHDDEDLYFRQEKEEVPTDQEVKAQKEKLNKVQNLLPSFRQQLVDLLELLDLSPKGTESHPNFPQALQLVESFGPTLRELYLLVNDLSPHIVSLGRKCSSIDQNYGVLKQFRLKYLRLGVADMIERPLIEFFTECCEFFFTGQYADPDAGDQRDRIISLSVEVFTEIDVALAVFTRSDLGVLQINWESANKALGDDLARITQRVNEFAGEPPEGNFRPRVVDLLQKAIPLVKMARIFLNKLVRNPPFTFDDKLPSAALEKLRVESNPISSNLTQIVDALLRCYETQQVRTTNNVPLFAGRVKRGMTESLELIRAYLQPLHSDATIPQEEVFNELFSLIKSNFFPACDAFIAAAEKFPVDFPQAR